MDVIWLVVEWTDDGTYQGYRDADRAFTTKDAAIEYMATRVGLTVEEQESIEAIDSVVGNRREKQINSLPRHVHKVWNDGRFSLREIELHGGRS